MESIAGGTIRPAATRTSPEFALVRDRTIRTRSRGASARPDRAYRRTPDGTRERISGCAPRHINTKVAAQEELRQHKERILDPERARVLAMLGARGKNRGKNRGAWIWNLSGNRSFGGAIGGLEPPRG